MRILLTALLFMVACGESAPEPAPEPPKKEQKAPAKAKAKAKAKAPGKAVDFANMNDAEKRTYLMTTGADVYMTGGTAGLVGACKTCHQENGEGTPSVFPPLKGAKEFMGDCKTHAGYVIKGLNGPIEVAGKKYNGVMPPQPTLTNMEIAAVITFERNTWGNDYGICSPADAAAARN